MSHSGRTERAGLEVAHKLRKSGSRVPILMLTARDAMPDIVQGLDFGADDYLTKSFPFEVLLARIRAPLRRGPISQAVRLRIDHGIPRNDLTLRAASAPVLLRGIQGPARALQFESITLNVPLVTSDGFDIREG